MYTLNLNDVTIEVTTKDIKNLHLSVYPPEGHVRVSAPTRMSPETIRTFLISKLSWIRKQQRKIQGQPRETPREYIDRESHFFRGHRYLLKTQKTLGRQGVEFLPQALLLKHRPGASTEDKTRIMESFYRAHLKVQVDDLIRHYEPIMGVTVNEFGIKKMKTRWGTCNPTAARIWINLELAKKPTACLEYIVVHEMVHLLEVRHNDRFRGLMDRFMPKWRSIRDLLNKLPTKHEEWEY